MTRLAVGHLLHALMFVKHTQVTASTLHKDGMRDERMLNMQFANLKQAVEGKMVGTGDGPSVKGGASQRLLL